MMNRFHLIVAGLGLAGVTVPVAASAAPWQSINARQDRLEQRIDRGIRSGQLSRGEAVRLRTQYRQIVRLEDRYRRTGGLSGWERQDLNRRFDALSARVRVDRQDRRYR
jgi:Tfp pilus assembly protein FimT